MALRNILPVIITFFVRICIEYMYTTIILYWCTIISIPSSTFVSNLELNLTNKKFTKQFEIKTMFSFRRAFPHELFIQYTYENIGAQRKRLSNNMDELIRQLT